MNRRIVARPMGRWTSVLSVFTAFIAGLGAVVEASDEVGARETIKVFVGFEFEPGPGEIGLVRAVGGEISHVYHLIPAIAAEIPVDEIEALREDPRVTRIELDGRVSAFDVDPEMDAVWGVKRMGTGTAHQGKFRGKNIRIAIIDSGMDLNHRELSERVVTGWDFVNNDPYPDDEYGHGTHIAGIIAATRDQLGIVGVAPRANLYVYKVLDSFGNGDWSDIVAAVEAAALAGCKVTNQSLGAFTNPGSFVRDMYDAAWGAGIVNVAASGNSGTLLGVAWPARYNSVIAVGATDFGNSRPMFSSTGPELELTAPGHEILSTKRGGDYEIREGTSQAAAHVAGAVAVVLSTPIRDQNRNGTVADEVRQRLIDTAVDLGDVGFDEEYGHGMVNLMAAIKEPMPLEATAMVRGNRASVRVHNGTPGENVRFYYSRDGGGTTVDLTMAANLAINIAIPIATLPIDATGEATVTFDVPANMVEGLEIRFQAAELGNTSTVVITYVE